MKRILFCIIFLFVVSPAYPHSSYYNFDSNHPYNPGINQGSAPICWEVAAASIIDWTGWGLAADQYGVLQQLQSHFPPNPGSPESAISYYLNQYYPEVRVSSAMYETWGYGSISALEQYINSGYGVDIWVARTSGAMSHIMTAWGYETNDQGIVDALYITNSWGYGALQEITVSQVNGLWYLSYPYSDGYLAAAIGLVQEDEYVPPAPPPPYTPPIIVPPDLQPNPIPEPGMMWLLGLALMVIVTVKYRQLSNNKRQGQQWALPFYDC